MTREETTALFARRQDAMNRHDVAGLTTFYAKDCVVESPTGGGVVKGLAIVEVRRHQDAARDVRLVDVELFQERRENLPGIEHQLGIGRC